MATSLTRLSRSQGEKLTRFNLTSQLVAYEEGDLDDSEVLELFQHLVDTGLAWSLQGSYGRQALRMLESGDIQASYTPTLKVLGGN